ncbi:MAG: tRNA (pseudouridine(54)-N(1))-methyltransferase TrmY [archaeon]|nr:tRNA (pseudouridine(54)-N(1))-methyltransferase TrmY [archaeon]MCR4323363.1 tRNA (pseudouridine(54)-N(1))-methyltransferase TrmY [Nanoarchaeota archaeon]
MKTFLYYSKSAVTAGNMIKDNLMQAGRMDIVCNVIISVFFTSNHMRDDVKLHLIFDGPPNAPRHLVLESNKDLPISKKDVAGLIKKMLYKSPNEEGLREIFPGASIEKKSFEKVIKELDTEGKDVLLLDGKGKDIREFKLKGNEVFIIGDQDGFPKDKDKFLKKIDKISVGPRVLFASQVITILHNELDRKL